MAMRSLWVGLFVLTLGLSGCAGAGQTEGVEADVAQKAGQAAGEKTAPPPGPQTAQVAESGKENAEADQTEKVLKRAKLARELEIARQKVRKAELALQNQRADDQAAIDKARVERELAEIKLKKFESQDAPHKLAETRLSLKNAQDNLKEQEEELEQLEMMYKEEDLADKTREIVLERGRRRLERARMSLANQQNALQILEQHTQPFELAELRSQVTQKDQALDGARRSAEAKLLEKQIDLWSAQAEVTRMEEELAELDKEPKK